jgi:hypothetical protein
MIRIIKVFSIGLFFLLTSLYVLAADGANTSIQTLSESKLALLQSIKAIKRIEVEVDFNDAQSFERYAQARKELNILVDQRKLLVAAAPEHVRMQLLGFGPEGVRNMQLELHWLNSLSSGLQLRRGWYKFLSDIHLSPMAVLSAIFQILFAISIFCYWRFRYFSKIKASLSNEGVGLEKQPNQIIKSILWRYQRIHNPFEYWLLLTFSLGVIAELWDFINFAPVQTILNWFLWGRVIIQLVDSFSAARYRRSHRKDEQAKLRFRSVKLLGYAFIVTGMLLALINTLGAGGGTLAAWIRVSFFWAVVPIFIIILRWWRPVVMKQLAASEHRDRVIPRWVSTRSSGLISLFAVIIGGGYLILIWLSHQILQVAGEREIVRSAMAYLFRVEVARQSAKEQERNKLIQVDANEFPEFDLGYVCKTWQDSVASEELMRVVASCESEKSTINIVYADRGRGKTSFLKRLELEIQNDLKVVMVQTPSGGGFAEILEELADVIGMGEDSGVRDLAAELKDANPMVILLDDVHRIIKPSIGGLKELERLVRFIRCSSQNISWVFAIEASSWQFVARARGERFLFDLELELPRWQEVQIAELIEMRTKISGLSVSYEGMVVPRQLDILDEPEKEQLSSGYARILWEYSKGNPGVALYLWGQSLFINEEETTLVRLFEIPDTSGLDGLSVTLLLVLRAILQLEQAVKVDVARATNLSSDEVVDALRLLTNKGYIIRSDANFYSIGWPWYRAITTVLNRQHLVIL